MPFWKIKKTKSAFTLLDEPIRKELLNVTHLEEVALEISNQHTIYLKNIKGTNLRKRVNENEDVLIESFKSIVKAVKNDRSKSLNLKSLCQKIYRPI